MENFFKLYANQSNLALEVGHNSVADWIVIGYDKRGKALGQYGDPIVHTSGCDRALAFAQAYVQLAEYLSDNRGGY